MPERPAKVYDRLPAPALRLLLSARLAGRCGLSRADARWVAARLDLAGWRVVSDHRGIRIERADGQDVMELVRAALAPPPVVTTAPPKARRRARVHR